MTAALKSNIPHGIRPPLPTSAGRCIRHKFGIRSTTFPLTVMCSTTLGKILGQEMSGVRNTHKLDLGFESRYIESRF
jgi:hypothetical protein